MVVMIAFQGEGKIPSLDHPTHVYSRLFSELMPAWSPCDDSGYFSDAPHAKRSLNDLDQEKHALDEAFQAISDGALEYSAYLGCIKFLADEAFATIAEGSQPASFWAADKKIHAINKQFGLHVIHHASETKAAMLHHAMSHYFKVLSLFGGSV
ncbi:hypothetical protein DSO57_1034641 [Entomophthora muscae]|uniref:Uncharacterized protein n=1 Tax=Entomophthora muscae TaxID=34485 RepID=A0ACC2RQX3_9FUNG|nr:hypothetical protein DSO57_1034641 [Entomophthora muscae]